MSIPPTPPPTGGFNAPSVLTPGNSQMQLLQGGPSTTDAVTGQQYAPVVTQVVDTAGVNKAAVNAANQILVSEIPPTTVTASASAGAAASNSATLPAVAGKTNYLTGFVLTSSNPAGTVNGLATVTGCLGGTLNFYFVESSTFGGEMIVNFPYPIPASGTNTAIVVNIPAITSGGSTAITVTGFVQ